MDKLAIFKQLVLDAKGLIFDFDGLLADSERFHFLAYNEVFEQFDHSLDETEYYKYWTSLGHGVRGEIERHNLDLDPIAIRREKMPIFSRYCEDGSIGLFAEAAEIIESMSRMDKTMAIASGTPSGDIRAVLRNAGLEDSFEVILGSDTVPKIKPAPDIFIETLSQIGLNAEDCVVFEDAEKGMFAAIEAGIPVIVVRNAQTSGFDFSRADLTIESHAEMADLLRRALAV